MKKILFIEATELRGGIESFILNMSSNLDKNKYSFSLLTTSDKASIEDDFKKLGGEVIHISSFEEDKKKYIKDFKRIISIGNYDVVHINKNSLANPLPVFLCQKYHIEKIILHSHNTHPTKGKLSGLVHNFFKLTLKKDRITKIACSEKARNWMFKPEDDVLILRNGIDINKYSFNKEKRLIIRKELEIEENAIVLCSVGRMCEQKNSLFIIDIFNSFLKLQPDALLVMVGTGELKDKVNSHIQELKIKDKVKLLGTRNDIPDILQAVDLFLMPSLHEGLPIAAVEAQASGLPMLISNTVDKEVAILDSSEFEDLENNSDIWAEHINKLLEGNVRKDTSTELRESGYDLKETIELLSKIYN